VYIILHRQNLIVLNTSVSFSGVTDSCVPESWQTVKEQLFNVTLYKVTTISLTQYTSWRAANRASILHHFLTFMGPCIVNIFKHNQQDATLHNGIYYYKCPTCFWRFLHPSSGANNCIQSIGYLSSFHCFLPLARMSWYSSPNSPSQTARSSESSTNTRCCVHSF
jgi:hypothetical protein